MLDPSLSTLLYSTMLGGSSDEVIYGLTLDGSGNVYVTGYSHILSDFPTTGGAYDETHNGFTDAFVSVLDPTLSTLLYSTFLGGDAQEHGYDIVFDSSGNVMVAGRSDSTTFPTTPGAYQASVGGFVSVLDPTLSTLLKSTRLGAAAYAERIALDSSDSVCLAGIAWSDAPITPGAYDTTHNGGSDVFVSVLNADLSALTYGTYLSGSQNEHSPYPEFRPPAVAMDADGYCWVSGMTASADFPTTLGAYNETYNGGDDIFMSVLDPAGVGVDFLLYSTFVGGSSRELNGGIVLDGSGNVYLAGRVGSADFPTTAGAYDESHNGSNDISVSKFSLPAEMTVSPPTVEIYPGDVFDVDLDVIGAQDLYGLQALCTVEPTILETQSGAFGDLPTRLTASSGPTRSMPGPAPGSAGPACKARPPRSRATASLPP